ncbi:DUF3806 domain-containing protein [Methylophaga sp. UBA3191]|uniref:DUF3806 domain-containing protein n=1 Tax=Methylophaga sp. UBA3191 TaxID=1946881 RepID=UPI0025D23DA9|nr:DUF3806 domain-containing protein [Methylophaga sp. UBA3191]
MRVLVGLIFSLLLGTLPLVAGAETFRTEALSEMDRRFMDNQVTALEDIARREWGRQFSGNKHNDLALLQRLLDHKLVKAEDTALLQGMGVVLGELLRKEKALFWTIYTDKLGRSRALEIPGKREFVFPITMISRRVEAGVDVQVREVYDKAAGIVDVIQDKRGFQ